MDDKTFERIEKLYNRMEEKFSAIDSKMDAGFKDVKQDIARVEQNMVLMENKYDVKFTALFDGLTANTEAINSLRSEMKTLETKVDDYEVKLKIVK